MQYSPTVKKEDLLAVTDYIGNRYGMEADELHVYTRALVLAQPQDVRYTDFRQAWSKGLTPFYSRKLVPSDRHKYICVFSERIKLLKAGKDWLRFS